MADERRESNNLWVGQTLVGQAISARWVAHYMYNSDWWGVSELAPCNYYRPYFEFIAINSRNDTEMAS